MAEKKDNFDNVEGKKPILSIKKNAIIGIVGLILIIVVSAFLKASLNTASQPQEKKNEKQEEQPKTQNSVDSLENAIKASYGDKKVYENKKVSYGDNAVKQQDVTPKENNDIDTIFGRNLKLEEYYVTMVDNELQARNSDIDYGIGDRTYTTKNDTTEVNSKKNNARNITNPYSITKPESQYEVKAGGVIPGILLTGINSELQGDIIGVVRESIYDTVTGKYLLIPKGTKILGQYNSDVNFGQSRLFIVWERLIFPNGNSIMLNNFPGVDMTGYAGMTGKVNNHTFKLFQSVVLSSILGGVASQIDTKQNKNKNNSLEEDIFYSAGEKIVDIGSNLADKIINISPTIEIAPGSRFNILINADLLLEPYQK